MATVQRANVVLQIPDEADIIQKYKDKGFDVIDNSTGEVLERAMPHDAGALQALVMELQEVIKGKDSEIAWLKKENQKLRKAAKKNESE